MSRLEQAASGIFLPVAGIIWLVIAIFLFFLGSQEFILADELLQVNYNIKEFEGLDETDTILLVRGEVYYEQPERTMVDTSPQGFIASFDDIQIIEAVAVAGQEQVVITLTQEVVAEEALNTMFGDNEQIFFTDAVQPSEIVVELTDDAETQNLLSVIESYQGFVAVEEFDDRLVVSLNEDADAPGFQDRFAANNNIESIEVITLNRLEVTLNEGVSSDAFVDIAEGQDFVTQVTSSPVNIVTVTPREGANMERVMDRTTEQITEYYPHADLLPNTWVPSFGTGGETFVNIGAVDTGIALFWVALAFALIETVMAFYFRHHDDKLVRPIVRVVGVFILFWSFFGHRPFWDFVLHLIFTTSPQLLHPSSTVVMFAAQHIELIVVSSLITVPLGLFIGIIVTREDFREFLPLVNSIVNSSQTVPTLAIVAIMAPVIGFGFWPAIIALVLYGLLPVVRNTIVGLESVDAFTIDSARGMGMTPLQILLQIELPIASRIIMAGVRTSMVVNVGTATLGAFVGSGGLGVPISSGLSMQIDPFVLLGALPAAMLAILIDYILGRVEFVLTPKGLQIEQ